MSDTVQAIVTRERGISHAGAHYPHNTIIALAPNQFEDWFAIGWVDRASREQIAAAKVAAAGDEPAKDEPAKAPETKAAKPA